MSIIPKCVPLNNELSESLKFTFHIGPQRPSADAKRCRGGRRWLALSVGASER